MDAFVQRIFETEVRFQCRAVLKAAEGIDDALDRMDMESTSDVWVQIQTLLIAAANVSKLLWGSGAKKSQDRAALQAKLGVAADSPLADVPDLRNDFEHFDERVEEWRASTTSTNFVGRNIGPASAIVIKGEPPNNRFQHFDPSTGEVSFLSRSVNLRPIIAEAHRIGSLIDAG